jgi:MscS family membrane protein
MKKVSTLILFIFSYVVVFGQIDESESLKDQPYQLNTPYQTILTHLKYLQDETFYPEISAKVIDVADLNDESLAKSYALKLKRVLDGKGIFVDMGELPQEEDYVDSITNRGRYYINRRALPQLYLVKRGENWYYSKSTINKIDQWYKEVYPIGTDKLVDIFPNNGRKYLGLYLWQIVGLFLIILMSFIIHKVFTLLFEKIILNLLHKIGYVRLADEVVRPTAKPISYLFIFYLLILFMPVLQFPIGINKYVVLLLTSVWPIFAIVFFYRLVDVFGMYLRKLAAKTESNLDDQLVPLARKILKTFVISIGVLVILDNLHVNITGILAGLSIGGLAFALAAQDTIKNFFGSLMIFIDKPFQVGDWITSGEVDGTVEEVGFRSTRVRTFRNSVISVPNGALADRMVDNHGLRAYRRFHTQLALTYDTPPALIEIFVNGLREIVKDHPDTRKDYYEIYLNEMANSSLNVMFYIFFEASSWSDELKGRHEILLSIIEFANEVGVNFAFPTQTLHMESFPDKLANSPSYEQDQQLLKEKVKEFLAINRVKYGKI